MDKLDKIKKQDESKILYTSFNQNHSHISVGTENGFQIYKCYPFELKLEKSKFK